MSGPTRPLPKWKTPSSSANSSSAGSSTAGPGVRWADEITGSAPRVGRYETKPPAPADLVDLGTTTRTSRLAESALDAEQRALDGRAFTEHPNFQDSIRKAKLLERKAETATDEEDAAYLRRTANDIREYADDLARYDEELAVDQQLQVAEELAAKKPQDARYKYAAHAVIWCALLVTVGMQECAGWSLPLGLSALT